jgi:hypothetical protein
MSRETVTRHPIDETTYIAQVEPMIYRRAKERDHQSKLE